MSIDTLIKHAVEKNASEFESTFNDIMSSKMSDIVAAKYDQMFGSEEQEDISFETETLEQDEEE